jgi:hypothetical protein
MYNSHVASLGPTHRNCNLIRISVPRITQRYLNILFLKFNLRRTVCGCMCLRRCKYQNFNMTLGFSNIRNLKRVIFVIRCVVANGDRTIPPTAISNYLIKFYGFHTLHSNLLFIYNYIIKYYYIIFLKFG